MTKLEMLKVIYDDYRTDKWWKNMVIREYGSLRKYAQKHTKEEIVEMYELYKEVE